MRFDRVFLLAVVVSASLSRIAARDIHSIIDRQTRRQRYDAGPPNSDKNKRIGLAGAPKRNDDNEQNAASKLRQRPWLLSFDQGTMLGDLLLAQKTRGASPCNLTAYGSTRSTLTAVASLLTTRTRRSGAVRAGQLIVDQLKDATRRAGPELALTGVCSLVFLMWQTPALRGLMQRHFLSSAWNVRQGRPHACLLSAISHDDFRHLFGNMAGLFATSPTVRPLLGKQYPWVFLGSVLVSDLFQTLRNPHGSSLGLSGFLMTLLALFAEYYPDSTLRLYIGGGAAPLQAKARHILYCALAHSVVMVLRPSGDGIGHAAHLGGLLYGVLYARWPRKSSR
jgi:membrane associated rhomboid family serine protease